MFIYSIYIFKTLLSPVEFFTTFVTNLQSNNFWVNKNSFHQFFTLNGSKR